MILTRPGKISDVLYMLGESNIPLYLLKGERPVAIDAGFACMGPIYAAGLAAVLEGAPLAHLLFTHAHFDHCGSAAFLKRAYPSLEIACSAQARETLARPKVQETIKSLSLAARDMLVRHLDYDVPDVAFEPFEVTRVLSGGDRVHAGHGLWVEAVETPGHTRDCLSFWVPEHKILFVSEAAGIPDATGYIICDHLIAYDLFMESLQKLAAFPVEILCLGHGAVLTGDDAKGYIPNAMRQAEDFMQWVHDLWSREGGDTQRLMRIIRAREYDSIPFPKQPEPAYLWNLRARIAAVEKKFQLGGAA